MNAPAAPAAGLTQAFAAFVANLRGPEVPAAVRAEAQSLATPSPRATHPLSMGPAVLRSLSSLLPLP